MKALSNEFKSKLKKLAHELKPVVLVGQKGITDTLLQAVDNALEDHELIKIKFIDFKDEKIDLTDKIIQATNSILVNIIGNIAIIYRENSKLPKEKKIRVTKGDIYEKV
jgi:RNA-binding protein